MLHTKPNTVSFATKKQPTTNNLYDVSNKIGAFKKAIADISIWMVLLQILKATRFPFVAGKHQLVEKYQTYFGKKPFPWFQLGLLAIGLYMVFQKDMHFQVNMKSPIQLFQDDQAAQGEPTALSMSLTHPGPSATLKKNSAISSLNLKDASVKAYIDRFSRISLMEMQKFNIPASIKMGQAILASHAGDNVLAIDYNNHFGTMCRPSDAPCAKYNAPSGKVSVKKYISAWESWRDHSTMISKAPYHALTQHGKDYKKWAVGIANIGYGGNTTYSQQLIEVIEHYQLYKLDEKSEKL